MVGLVALAISTAGFRCPGASPSASSDEGSGGASAGGADAGGGSTGGAGGCAAPGCAIEGKRVFVTSTFVVPTFGGALEGDAICQAHADDAMLGGAWMAWLSDAATSPATRFTPSDLPYVLLDGSIIAADWAGLTDVSGAGLLEPIDQTEMGEAITADPEVWTATTHAGLYDGISCAGWTTDENSTDVLGTVGSANSPLLWTNVFLQYCDRTNVRLYCFEQ